MITSYNKYLSFEKDYFYMKYVVPNLIAYKNGLLSNIPNIVLEGKKSACFFCITNK